MITLRVIGKPRPQARPRKGRGHWYSPKNDWFQTVYASALQARPTVPMTGPTFIGIEFIFPAGRHNGWHTSRPDTDNLLKAVLDAVVLARWVHDDASVCVTVTSKRHATPGEKPGAIITAVEVGHGSIIRQILMSYAGGL